MLKRALVSIFAIQLLPLLAFANVPGEKVAIYNLEVFHEKRKSAEERAGRGERGYDYYSFIIPAAITRNLNEAGMVRAQKIDGNLPLDDLGSDAFFEHARTISAEHAARFIIGGKCTIRGKKLAIELVLVDAEYSKTSEIKKESFETGAELKEIIADLTAEIEEKLRISQKEKKEKIQEKKEPHEERKASPEEYKETPKEPAVSPFLKMYRALDGLSFGVNTGRIFIKGPFSKIYEDSDYVCPYISYDILKWLGVSAEADYLAAQNGTIVARKESTLQLWAITLNIGLTYQFFKYLGINLTAGFGASIGRIVLNTGDNPFSSLTATKKSTDPYLNISGSFRFTYKPLVLQFGGAYKSAFFKGKTLSLVAVFFGIGYHL